MSAPISPKQVQSNSGSPTNTIELTWATPHNLIGHHVNSLTYQLDYCLKQENIKYGCKTKYEKGTSTLLRGLTSGTRYFISIRAITATGETGVPTEIEAKTSKDVSLFHLFYFLIFSLPFCYFFTIEKGSTS